MDEFQKTSGEPSLESQSAIAILRTRRDAELASYFFFSPAKILGNVALREPQEEAYFALRRYFSHAQKLPAMVEIPTGCGKTGIICIAPFRIARGRVLIVAPNITVRDTLVRSISWAENTSFSERSNFYLKCKIFSSPAELPRVTVLERGRTSLEDCLRADIVVANIQQLVGWLEVFDERFFDFIIVDEAHHVPAESWQKVALSFPAAKNVYLTATPFRSDSQPIRARSIYQYQLSRAIQNEYIKNIVRVDAVASRLTFTLEGLTREFSFDEIAKLREEFWFSKGVALSEVCNQTIVAHSIALLNEKRQDQIFHQLIAAACSIRHAQQLVALYCTAGLRATYVASQGMTREEREARLKAYESGEFDCIVQVGILGEGYDHPNVSVAAVFRPYRSLSPYAQFVGRTLRRIDRGNGSDNLAHIVGHVGLNLEPLWIEFKREARKQGHFRHSAEPQPERESLDEATETNDANLPTIIDQEIAGLDIDIFLANLSVQTGYREVTGGEVMAILTTLTHAASETDVPMLETVRTQSSGAEPDVVPHILELRPDLERAKLRQRLNQEIRRAAGFILYELGLEDDGSLAAVLGEHGEQTNYEVIIRALNREINHALHKDQDHSHREDWLQEELEAAFAQTRSLRDMLLFKIRLVTNAHRQKKQKKV